MTATTTTTMAAGALLGALERASVIGATKKGRTITEMTGTPSEAETEWHTMCAVLCLVRMVRRSFVTELA